MAPIPNFFAAPLATAALVEVEVVVVASKDVAVVVSKDVVLLIFPVAVALVKSFVVVENDEVDFGNVKMPKLSNTELYRLATLFS